jgi:hypothetical protein
MIGIWTARSEEMPAIAGASCTMVVSPGLAAVRTSCDRVAAGTARTSSSTASVRAVPGVWTQV